MAYERDGKIVNALVHQVAFTRILPLLDKIQYPPTSKLIVTTFFPVCQQGTMEEKIYDRQVSSVVNLVCGLLNLRKFSENVR